MDRGQPTQMATPPAAQGPSSGQLQVTGWWDKTPVKMSFDPNGTGTDFYQAFHQWAAKRNRGEFDRQRMTLWLKASKTTPDEEAYEIELKEDELEEPELWKAAQEWIHDNKNPKPPHLYVTVEMEPG
jgi:hypothetical protein